MIAEQDDMPDDLTQTNAEDYWGRETFARLDSPKATPTSELVRQRRAAQEMGDWEAVAMFSHLLRRRGFHHQEQR
jgi:hypothetical protein